MNTQFETVNIDTPIHNVIDQLIQDRLLAIPVLADQKFFGVFTIFDATHHNQTILDMLEGVQEVTPEQVRQVQVGLWSMLRNVSMNHKLLAVERAPSSSDPTD